MSVLPDVEKRLLSQWWKNEYKTLHENYKTNVQNNKPAFANRISAVAFSTVLDKFNKTIESCFDQEKTILKLPSASQKVPLMG